jgi:hypothetical protein
MASPRLPPHISTVGRSLTHTSGRSGCPNKAQRKSGSSCTQGMLAGFPNGMPGIGELIDGATQQAPQCGLQFIPRGKITPAAYSSSAARDAAAITSAGSALDAKKRPYRATHTIPPASWNQHTDG